MIHLDFFWNACRPVDSKEIVVFSKCRKFQDKVNKFLLMPVGIVWVFLHQFSRNSQMLNNITFKSFILNFVRTKRYMWGVEMKCIHATKWIVAPIGFIFMKNTITQYNL